MSTTEIYADALEAEEQAMALPNSGTRSHNFSRGRSGELDAHRVRKTLASQ